MDVRHTPVVVLAGGTGTGKSTLGRALAAEGAAVVDADVVGHEMLRRRDVRNAVVDTFGPDVLDDEGAVDRRRLGAIVFSDPARLAALNRLVHPPLVAEIERRIDRLRRDPAIGAIVIDAALWPQFEPRPSVDLVVMTTAPRPVRRQRIVERDGIDSAAAERRLERQEALEAFLDDADAVLDTARPRSETRQALFDLLDQRFGPGWRRPRPSTGV
ncbi:MAG TPA: dephospho-CoA kinase [Candidatus Krumholzibacteria bacterium]|nr:dephospho-CoA kinase [Candidatus Krumholzibacteria bacterium]